MQLGMDTPGHSHSRLRTHCGLCGRSITAGNRFVSVLRDGETIQLLEEALFPLFGPNAHRLRNRLLCWIFNCRRCGRTPDAFGIHKDCFNLFMQNCQRPDALELIWLAAASRQPWKGALDLQLDNDSHALVDKAYQFADACGLPHLKSLPPELMSMVLSHSGMATFWRYLLVVLNAEELTERNPEPLMVTRLGDVVQWTRGQRPVLSRNNQSPIIRLTLDSRGIKQVERLESKPPYENLRSGSRAFIIDTKCRLNDVQAHFENGILRLEMYNNTRGLHIWDMPCPPAQQDFTHCGHIAQASRFTTIDLHAVTGLTFLFAHQRVYGIHAHTAAEPTAMRNFDKLAPRRRGGMAWIHLPIPKGEEIRGIGIRYRVLDWGRVTIQKPGFLIRTKVAGDVLLGNAHLTEPHDDILCHRRPRLFIYNSFSGGSATVFGTFPRDQQPSGELQPVFRRAQTNSPNMNLPYYSVAPLKNVARVHVFHDDQHNISKALIFEYDDGAQRAIGNCRIGMDQCVTYERPTRICYTSTTYQTSWSTGEGTSVRIECGTDRDLHGEHEEPGWHCTRMRGSMKMWFSDDDNVIELSTAESGDEDEDKDDSAI